MMHGAGRVGFGKHDACPERFRPDKDVRDGCQPPHPGCLRRLVVELKGLDDPDSLGLVWDRGPAPSHINLNRHRIPRGTRKRAEAFTTCSLFVTQRGPQIPIEVCFSNCRLLSACLADSCEAGCDLLSSLA